MGIDLALPAWSEAVGQAARHRSSRGCECVALHRHDGVPVADDAQGFSAFYNCAVLFLRVASDRVMGPDQPSSCDGDA